jgi:hypothetical protein
MVIFSFSISISFLDADVTVEVDVTGLGEGGAADRDVVVREFSAEDMEVVEAPTETPEAVELRSIASVVVEVAADWEEGVVTFKGGTLEFVCTSASLLINVLLLLLLLLVVVVVVVLLLLLLLESEEVSRGMMFQGTECEFGDAAKFQAFSNRS